MAYEQIPLTWQYRARAVDALAGLLLGGWQPVVGEVPQDLRRLPLRIGAAVASMLPGVHPQDQRWIAMDLAERLGEGIRLGAS